MTNLQEKLLQVQGKLKAPKGRTNNFGGYNYRSCEDILTAVKPLLGETGLVMTLTDEITEIGGRVYVKATATITDGKEEKIAVGLAREGESKKGMDPAQLTGATSSYARKYALNGMFLIDDNKDFDTDEFTKEAMEREKANHRRSKVEDEKKAILSKLEEYTKDKKITCQEITVLISQLFNLKRFNQLNNVQAKRLLTEVENAISQRADN